MKENVLFTLVLLFLVGGLCPASAQGTGTDVVTMKDGKTLTGKVVHYEPGKTLQLQLKDGSVTELSDTEIASIKQGAELSEEVKGNSKNSLKTAQPAKTHGFYTVSMLSFYGGSSNNEGLSLGAGASQVFGYQLNSLLGVGAGVGFDNYSRRGETVYPIFGEVRSFLPSKKQTSNFYALVAGGYSLGFPRESLDISSAKGGIMGQIAFGHRAATVEGLDICVDLGVKFQRAHFERELYNGDLEVRDIDFRRIVIRVGIGFWNKKAAKGNL